jgi:hypothetical protein
MRNYYASTRFGGRLPIAGVGKEMEEWISHSCCWDCIWEKSLWETVWDNLLKLVLHPHDPEFNF